MNDARERIEDGKDQVINGELEELSCSIEKVEIKLNEKIDVREKLESDLEKVR